MPITHSVFFLIFRVIFHRIVVLQPGRRLPGPSCVHIPLNVSHDGPVHCPVWLSMCPVRENNAHFESSPEQIVRLRQSKRYRKRCSIPPQTKEPSFVFQRPPVVFARDQEWIQSRRSKTEVEDLHCRPQMSLWGRGKSTRGPARHLPMINQIARLMPDFCFWTPPFLSSQFLVRKGTGCDGTLQRMRTFSSSTLSLLGIRPIPWFVDSLYRPTPQA